MKFLDRNEAGRLLSEELIKKEIKYPIVVAIPRGGIPVADPIVQALDAPLRLSMTRKIGHPFHEEYAIGAVSLDNFLLSPQQQVENKYIEELIEKERRRIREMIRTFDHEIKEEEIKGKTVLLVDDGIATGKTIQLAAEEIRQMKPLKLLVCVPVCSITALEILEKEVDEIITLKTPVPFSGVGSYYQNFNQLTDSEVIEIIRKCKKTVSQTHSI